MSRSWDVIVVGAGPGGSAAAFYCARAGLRTVLLDRARFPRDKTCGDGVGAGGVDVLRTMGVYDRLVEAGAGLATGYGLQSPGGEQFHHRRIVYESTLRPEPLLIAPRVLLDEACVRAAQAAGAELRENCRVKGLLQEQGQVCGVTLDDGATLDGRLVIGADGVHSQVARALGQLDRDPRHRAFALRTYYRGLRAVESDVHFVYDERFMPAYFWVFPLPEGRANVGVGRFDRYTAADAPPLPQLFNSFIEDSPLVRRLLAGGEPEGRLQGWPLRLGTGAGSGVASGALLVGDANGFIDPLTGEGIHFALRSGELAAQTAIEALHHGDLSAVGLASYERRWRSEFQDEFRMADRALDLLMNHSRVSDAVVAMGRDERDFAVRLGEVFAGLRPKRDLLTVSMLARLGLRMLRMGLRWR
ncbi:MAG: NAD(P)/FAD-dependent oxidoreductase [Pseudomonadota bacterium]